MWKKDLAAATDNSLKLWHFFSEKHTVESLQTVAVVKLLIVDSVILIEGNIFTVQYHLSSQMNKLLFALQEQFTISF